MSATRSGPYDGQRLLGRYRADEPGPTVLCLGGIHGNEPAGVEGLRRVLSTLENRRPPFRGELVGAAGNLGALARGVRYLQNDLNRHWRADRIEAIQSGSRQPLEAEDLELLELHELLQATVQQRRGRVFFVDLHTTSSRSAPFAVINDTLANRRFAMHFPVPVILGLEEHVQGTIADYAHGIGCITMGFE
ncbi:MAG: aspartoacylase, partial [Planctomycetota bacterium]